MGSLVNLARGVSGYEEEAIHRGADLLAIKKYEAGAKDGNRAYQWVAQRLKDWGLGDDWFRAHIEAGTSRRISRRAGAETYRAYRKNEDG